ncbi:cupin-like domain-containing protein [Burkholderia paludis]|uniref:cupin-like domain-containing protein n=1 Tax=Burkholderia paludis TaxID=1506587 RepID=UPI0009DFD406|nr:cupin-like domain-containing protein [Burkholderia paludis]
MENIRQRIMAASRLVGDISSVPRVSPLEPNVFSAFAAAGLPFIIVGIVSTWPLHALTPDGLVERFSGLRVRARIGDYVSAAFSKKRESKEMSLAEYFSLLKHGTPGLPPYLGNQKLPELDALCRWPHYFTHFKDLKIWIGPSDTVTPLHCDYDDNLLAQVWGTKRILLFPPHYAENLYLWESNPVLFGSRFNPEAPDFSKFPLAQAASGCQCMLKAGEMLYLPAGWFHHVRSTSFSLSSNMWAKGTPAVCGNRGEVPGVR